MVTVEALEALDLSLWLQTGEAAGGILHCDQSTISRRKSKVLSVFKASLARHDRGWRIDSDFPRILEMEREVHQWNRLTKTSKLRLHIPYWSHHVIRPYLPEPVVCNPPESSALCDNVLELLRSRVVDACILTPTQLNGVDCEDLELVDLYASPINLYCLPSFCGTSHRPLSPSTLRGNSRLQVASFLPLSCRKSCHLRYKELTGFENESTFNNGSVHNVSFLTPLMSSHFPHAFKTAVSIDWAYRETLVFLKALSSNPRIQELSNLVQKSFLGLTVNKGACLEITVV